MHKILDMIDTLWLWTYGIIAGWGITFTLVVIALVLLLVRTINLQKRIIRLENRQVADARDLSLRITKIDKNLP
jgi:heme exporter protein D